MDISFTNKSYADVASSQSCLTSIVKIGLPRLSTTGLFFLHCIRIALLSAFAAQALS